MTKRLNPIDYGARGPDEDSIEAFEECSRQAQAQDCEIEITEDHRITRRWDPLVSVKGSQDAYIEIDPGTDDDDPSYQYGQAIGYHRAQGKTISGLRISGNHLTRGIQLSQCVDCHVVNCQVDRCAVAGIQVDLSHRCTVRGNRINDVVYHPQTTPADCILIQGCHLTHAIDNQCSMPQRIGIVVEGNSGKPSHGCDIIGNLITGTYGSDFSTGPNNTKDKQFNAAWWVEHGLSSRIIGNVASQIDNQDEQSKGWVRGAAIGATDDVGTDHILIRDNIIEMHDSTYWGLTIRGNPQDHRSVVMSGNRFGKSAGIDIVGKYASIAVRDTTIADGHRKSNSPSGYVNLVDVDSDTLIIDHLSLPGCKTSGKSCDVYLDRQSNIGELQIINSYQLDIVRQ